MEGEFPDSEGEDLLKKRRWGSHLAARGVAPRFVPRIAAVEEPTFSRINRNRRRLENDEDFFDFRPRPRVEPYDRPRRRLEDANDDDRFIGRRPAIRDEFTGQELIDVSPPVSPRRPALPDSPDDGFRYDDPMQVDLLEGVPVDPRPLVVKQASDGRLEELSRWQDKQSNHFSYFRIRGGLPNFQLLDVPTGPSDVKFHITQYMHYVEGQTEPQNSSNFIRPFAFGNNNSINPYATSAQYLSGRKTSEPLLRIQYGCLNAISSEVTVWPEMQVEPTGYGYRGIPVCKNYGNYNLPDPNVDCLPDPEHCIAPLGVSGYYNAGTGTWINIPNAVYTWPYDSLYHRTSSSVQMHNLRISGTVRAQEYRRQILCEAPLINGVYWANLVRYVRPTIFIVVFLDRTGIRSGDNDFDDVVDAVGQDVSTTQVPTGTLPYHDATLPTYTAVVPRVYAEIPSNCEVLAFECIDMSGNEDSYNSPRYLTYAPGYFTDESGVPIGEHVPADATATYSAVDMPFEERPFVFDIDLNGLVVNFRKDHFNYLLPVSQPQEAIGCSMLANNSIHIAAYCHYPGFAVTQAFDTTSPTAERLSYCQPISIGYTSHLTFKDFVID